VPDLADSSDDDDFPGFHQDVVQEPEYKVELDYTDEPEHKDEPDLSIHEPDYKPVQERSVGHDHKHGDGPPDLPEGVYKHFGVELELLAICRLKVPTKKLPMKMASRFAQVWSSILNDALVGDNSVSAEKEWIKFFQFPIAMLLAPVRGGKKVRSFAAVLQDRLSAWQTDKAWPRLWQEVVKRHSDLKIRSDGSMEKAAISALREGDVCKALRSLISAPIAADTPATFAALADLHPVGPDVVRPEGSYPWIFRLVS
jgi:hypothetical protein